MELKDKTTIVAAITGILAFVVATSTFLFGPGITKASISVDYSIKDNISFTSATNPMDLNPDPANPTPYERLESASLHISITYSNKGATPASIGRLWVIVRDAEKSQTCNGDPENGAPVHILNPEGQSAFAQQGKIPAGDIERANYEVRLFSEAEQERYPRHALICAIVNGTDSNISTKQAVVFLGRFNYDNSRGFTIGTNPIYIKNEYLNNTAPKHLLP